MIKYKIGQLLFSYKEIMKALTICRLYSIVCCPQLDNFAFIEPKLIFSHTHSLILDNMKNTDKNKIKNILEK